MIKGVIIILLNLKESASLIGCSTRTIDRYQANGRISPVTKNGKKFFKKTDLLKIATKILGNQDIHRPASTKIHLAIAPTKLDAKQFLKINNDLEDVEILNDKGRAELVRISAYLKEKGFFEIIDKGSIMRYAIATQMREKYLKLAEFHQPPSDDKLHPYFNIAKNFQLEIQHYEKELGLTAAAASKLNMKEAPTEDPMSKYLN